MSLAKFHTLQLLNTKLGYNIVQSSGQYEEMEYQYQTQEEFMRHTLSL
jgi:hypothetical protein